MAVARKKEMMTRAEMKTSIAIARALSMPTNQLLSAFLLSLSCPSLSRHAASAATRPRGSSLAKLRENE